MLVLSRKVGEKLVIGGNITVVVTRVAGNRVTLGIEAPQDVRVVRGELQPVPESEPVRTRAHEHEHFRLADDAAEVAVARLAK